MFTKNIKDTFTASLLGAVSGVLGEAKKKPCAEGCECDACSDTEDTNEGYMPTNDAPSDKDRKTAGKLGALLKREREAKEKKEPNGVKESNDDVPFDGPYRKAGERKDEYGNKVKNVAKHLAKKAMKANEEFQIDENHQYVEITNAHTNSKSYVPVHKTQAFAALNHYRSFSHNKSVRIIDKKQHDAIQAAKTAGVKEAWDVKKGTEVVSSHKSKDEVDVKAMKNPMYKVVAKEEAEIEEAVGDITVKKISPDEAFKKHTGQMTKKTSVPKDPKTGKTLYQKVTSEEVEELDEAINFTAHDAITKGHDGKSYNDIFNAHGSSIHNKIRAVRKERDENPNSKHARFLHTRMLGAYADWYRNKKAVKEESEQIDELSKGTLGRYLKRSKDEIDADSYTRGMRGERGQSGDAYDRKLERNVVNRHAGSERAIKKLTKEEAEQIDELSKGTMGRYINRAAMKMSTQGVTAGLKIAADEKSKKNFDDIKKREKGIKLAVNKLTKEEQDFIDSLNDVDIEQIDELSKDAMLKYLSANKKDDTKARETGDYDKMTKRMRGTDMAVRKYTAKPGSKSVRVPATEEVELDEARGRPRKAGAKDFTINPRTKEKLMHNNPEHMKKIELLQKNGVIARPKTEAGQNIMTQLQKAKTSMTGGSTVHFTHGDSKEVSGTHAARLLDKHAGMKPDEKEAFQKKIGHSHANLKSEL